MSCSILSKSPDVRPFKAGNVPNTPALHASTTSWTPDTKNIGATTNGSCKRFFNSCTVMLVVFFRLVYTCCTARGVLKVRYYLLIIQFFRLIRNIKLDL